MSKSDAFLQAGRTAVLQNIHGTMQFLQRFPPFNQMENTHLAFLVEQCQLRFYGPGDSIIRPEDGPVEHFYIVKQGRVIGERTHQGASVVETTFEITAGECFPLAALLGERATRTEHLAAEDTFCLQLNKAAFIKVFALSEEFRDFALRGVSSLLDKVNRQVQQKAVETLGTQYSLNTRLGELAMRHPVTCSPQTALREAVRLMHEQQVGSIVIVNEHKAPLGIFTLRDLRQVVANGIEEFDQAIDAHMTAGPFYLSPDHSAFDAAIAMTERHIAHVCLVKEQRLCGVVSERDLFSLQRVDLVHLARTIRHAPRLDTLINLRGEISQLVE
ncbi:MAG: CBS domain-containing protein, partial [Pseudomonas sp.]|nr:CBS domain-containing protein [Pseudomonas sp.]